MERRRSWAYPLKLGLGRGKHRPVGDPRFHLLRLPLPGRLLRRVLVLPRWLGSSY
jgi:hypothetical protein